MDKRTMNIVWGTIIILLGVLLLLITTDLIDININAFKIRYPFIKIIDSFLLRDLPKALIFRLQDDVQQFRKAPLPDCISTVQLEVIWVQN